MAMAMRTMARRVQRAAAAAGSSQAALLSSASVTNASATRGVGTVSRSIQVASFHAKSSTQTNSTMVAIAAIAAAAVAGTVHCAAANEPVQVEIKENPIQHVAALLRLYDEIDKNMDVLAGRLLEDLQKRVEKEKEQNDGKLQLSPEQIALNMSIEFESTLEKVQDAVFRNNYVTKDQVREALQRLSKGELRGGGPKGKLTVQEAEAIEGYVKRIERLRWKVTGSREPLINTHNKPLVKGEKPKVPLETVVQVMEKLIPQLTSEMETIVKGIRASSGDLPAPQQHQLIAAQYIKRSGELTEKLCSERQLDLHAFQAALIFYHDDPLFEKALARLSADQQRRFAALGL